MKVKKIYMYLLLIVFLCIGLTIKSFQNDVFYMIKIGKDIFRYGIDFEDHYSWISNLPYTYPHWLYDVIVYVIYKYFGFFGIYIHSIILYILFAISFFYVSFNYTKDSFLSMFATFVSIFCISIFVSGRSLILTTTLFFWEVYFINKVMSNNNKFRYMVFLVLISIIIANVHATVWLFYFILYLPFFGVYVCLIYLKKYNKKINNRFILEEVTNIKKLLFSFVFGFLAGIVSPSRICYTYVIRIMLGNTQAYISEHLPLIVIENPSFLLLFLLIVLIFMFSNVKIYLREFFMVVGLSFMCLTSCRHLVFFYTIGVLYVTIFSYRYFILKKDNTFKILGSNKKILVICSLFVIFISCYMFNRNYSRQYIEKKEYPVDATRYIKNNLDYKNIHLYNEYNVGSYLLFNDIPVFIDSRCDLYLKEFNGYDDIFNKFVNIDKNYNSIFNKYNVDYVLVGNSNMLNYILRVDSNYNREYKDKYFSIYERKEKSSK